MSGNSATRPGHEGDLRHPARARGSAAILTTLALLGFAALRPPIARGAVEFYAAGSLGTLEMTEVNERVEAGNRQCARMEWNLTAAGMQAECALAPSLRGGVMGEAGVAVSAGKHVGVVGGYQYLSGATAWTLESNTGGSTSSYGQTYTASAQGPVVKVFVGMPGPQLSALLFAGVGQYQATYKEQSQIKGRVDDPDAVWYSETYGGQAPGYEVGFELRSGLGPQAVLTASVGYGWLRVRTIANHDGDPGPELDFSGLRFRGGLGLSF